jgi:type I restriction enzyme S subunit
MNKQLLMEQARVKKMPLGWDINTVGASCRIRNDLRKPISVEEREKIQGDYPYYGPTGILSFISEFLVEGRYCLIGEDGDHFLKHDEKDQTILVEGKFNVNNHAHIIEGTASCSVEWFYQYFKHRNITPFLSRQGAGRYKLNKETLQKLPILLPSFPEQTAIADLFFTWDEAIAKTERLIAAKEKRYTGLSGKLLFGNSSASSNFTKSTRWFAVPDHWKIVKIGSYAKEVKSTNNSGDTIPVLSCTKYDGLVDSLSYFGKQVFSLDTSTYKVVSRGEFAYATNHIEEGSIGYQNLYDKGLVSPMYTVFKTGNSIDDSYLYKVLKTETYRHIFQVNTSASVDRRGSLRWNEFTQLPIPLPPIEEQRWVVEVLDTARREIDLMKQQADALRRQKRGLMQKLLSGDWRIKREGQNDNEQRI